MMTKPTSEQVTHNGQNLNVVLGPIVNVKAFGATGDGVTDDTAAVQAALDAAAGTELVFAPGTYLVYALKVSGNTTVNLGTATIKKRPAVNGDLTPFQFTGSSIYNNSGYAPLFYLTGNDIVIKNGTIDGNRANETLNATYWHGSFANLGTRAGITGTHNAIASCRNLTVRDIHFMNMVGCAINVDMDGYIRVRNCTEENAGHLFAHIQADSVLVARDDGKLCEFRGNSLAGDRIYAQFISGPAPNPLVIHGFDSVTFGDNKLDETETSVRGGCKFQQSANVTISGNTFIDTYIKPQAGTGFLCKSFAVTGNTMLSNRPTTHVCGIDDMNMPCRSMTISGNTVINGVLRPVGTEDTSLSITGNSILWTIDPGATSSSQVDCIRIPGTGGRVVVSGNTVDGGNFNAVQFFRPPDGGGVNMVTGNVVMNIDSVIPQSGFVTASAGTEYHLIGNAFVNCRTVGRFNLAPNCNALVVKGNYFGQLNPLAPNNLFTSQRNLTITFNNSSYTVDTIVIEGNTWDASYGDVVTGGGNSVLIIPQNPVTVSDFVVRGNTMMFSEPTSAVCITMLASSATFTNVHIQDNYMLGNFQFSSGATVTNEHVGMNSFGVVSSVRSRLTNLTQKAVGITGTLSTTVGSAGAASALPATPTGYVTTVIDGTSRKVPYYAS